MAESDCHLAIALDSKYVKAYVRRAATRAALKKHQEALEGLQITASSYRVCDGSMINIYLVLLILFIQIMKWFSNWILKTQRRGMKSRNSSRCVTDPQFQKCM